MFEYFDELLTDGLEIFAGQVPVLFNHWFADGKVQGFYGLHPVVLQLI